MLTRRARLLPTIDPADLVIAGGIAALAALLVVLPPLLGASLVLGGAVSIVSLVRPLWGFYLLLLSIPLQDVGAIGELTATNVLFFLVLGAWLLRRVALGGEPLPRSAVGPCFALFVAGLTLSIVVAQELGPAVAALFQWLKSVAVYCVALDLLRTRRQAIGALAALLVAGAGEATIGLFQYVTGAGPESFAIGAQFSRAYGTFGRPNSYAGYLEMILPLGLVLVGWAWRRGRVARWATAGGTALVGGAILASFSRGAWLGIAGALAAMILLTGARARGIAITVVIAGGLLGVLGGVAALPADVRDRFDSILGNAETPDVRTAYITAENFAVVERLAHWQAGLNMFASDRLLGVGLGNFNVRYSEFNVSPTFLVSQGHAHNYYIHVAAEAGLVGLGTYLLLLAAIVWTGLRALRAASVAGRDPFGRAVVIACLGTVTAVAIHNFFENLHVLSLGVQLSVVWALPTIVAQGGWATRPAGSEERK